MFLNYICINIVIKVYIFFLLHNCVWKLYHCMAIPSKSNRFTAMFSCIDLCNFITKIKENKQFHFLMCLLYTYKQLFLHKIINVSIVLFYSMFIWNWNKVNEYYALNECTPWGLFDWYHVVIHNFEYWRKLE